MLKDPNDAPTDSILPKEPRSLVATLCDTFSTWMMRNIEMEREQKYDDEGA